MRKPRVSAYKLDQTAGAPAGASTPVPEQPAMFDLRLYVAGGAPHSLRAIANLEALRRDHLADRSRIEVVDVFRHPDRAVDEAVLLTPMLVAVQSGSRVRIIGDLEDTPTVLAALGLSAA